MIQFVNLMEPTQLDPNDEKMDMYWESNEFILEPIEEGRRYQCLISENNVAFSTKKERSKKGLIDDKVPEIIENLKTIIPQNSLLDGYLTTGNYNETLRILESKTETSLELQKKHHLKFIIMDVIYWNNEQLAHPFFDRRKIVEKIKNTMKNKTILEKCAEKMK